jgi:hypothetical protein
MRVPCVHHRRHRLSVLMVVYCHHQWAAGTEYVQVAQEERSQFRMQLVAAVQVWWGLLVLLAHRGFQPLLPAVAAVVEVVVVVLELPLEVVVAAGAVVVVEVVVVVVVVEVVVVVVVEVVVVVLTPGLRCLCPFVLTTPVRWDQLWRLSDRHSVPAR